jgi:hypothetical protein
MTAQAGISSDVDLNGRRGEQMQLVQILLPVRDGVELRGLGLTKQKSCGLIRYRDVQLGA